MYPRLTLNSKSFGFNLLRTGFTGMFHYIPAFPRKLVTPKAKGNNSAPGREGGSIPSNGTQQLSSSSTQVPE